MSENLSSETDSATGLTTTDSPTSSLPNGTATEDLLDDYVVNSKETFDEITSSPRDIAGLYLYQQLDELIDLARAISFDFFARPQLYDDLEDSTVVSDLARLHARYGHNEKFLSREQRHMIYEGVFTAGEEQFTGGRDALLYAAAKFAERAYNTGEDMLRTAWRDAARTFKAYLTTLPGTSLSWTRGTVLPEMTDRTAYRILRDNGIRSVFGQLKAVDEEWPYQVDGKGDELVEEAVKRLHESGLYEPAGALLNRDRFGKIQRVALRGSEAIAAIIDYDDRPDRDVVNHLILKCYSWHSALIQVAPPTWASVDSEDGNRSLMRTEGLSAAW